MNIEEVIKNKNLIFEIQNKLIKIKNNKSSTKKMISIFPVTAFLAIPLVLFNMPNFLLEIIFPFFLVLLLVCYFADVLIENLIEIFTKLNKKNFYEESNYFFNNKFEMKEKEEFIKYSESLNHEKNKRSNENNTQQ